MIPEPPRLPSPSARRFAVFLKLAGIGFLLLLLQLPLVMTHGVLNERQAYQHQAEQEIMASWGQSQLVTGPILAVPYTITHTWQREVRGTDNVVKTVEESSVTRGCSYFLPAILEAKAEVAPEVRYRGIYEVVVYSAQLRLSGTFSTDLTDIPVERAVYEWDRARLMMGVTDARRLRSAPSLKFDGTEYAVEAQTADMLGLAAKVRVPGPGKTVAFEVGLDLQGSGRLEFAPVGKRTSAEVRSTWASPSFTGGQLPASRQIGPGGFAATWRMAHYGRGYPQSWDDGQANTAGIVKRILDSGFGVSFMQPVDGYAMVERAQKYGTLFFVLIFAVFFLFEVTSPLRIHPLQYAMVGAALCLFFLGFLALTEFWRTGAAYAVAAGACTLLVSLYAWSFLRTGGRTLVIGGGLAGTYGYLYFVLQSQDYALVAGTAALFAVLALVMYCTRRINWYAVDVSGTANAAAPGPV